VLYGELRPLELSGDRNGINPLPLLAIKKLPLRPFSIALTTKRSAPPVNLASRQLATRIAN
jgi:hypothetical protein